MDAAPPVEELATGTAHPQRERIYVLVDRAGEDLTVRHAGSPIEDAPRLEAVQARAVARVQDLERRSGAVDDQAVVVRKRRNHDAGGAMFPLESPIGRVDRADGSVVVSADGGVAAGGEELPLRKSHRRETPVPAGGALCS